MIEKTVELEVQNLHFQYIKNKEVFRKVSFSLVPGDILSILGGNGAGKSTLLCCIAGLLRPFQGEIMLNHKRISSMSRNEIAKTIGFVPQLHGSDFAYSVLEYTVMGRAPYIRLYQKPSENDYAIARHNLEKLNMIHLEHKIFTELSGGEQQLVMIARVLTQETPVIILDEPSNHLDYGNQYHVLDILRQLASEGYMIMISTHNPDHALMLGGKAAILQENGILITGETNQLLTGERLSAQYHSTVYVEYNATAGRNLCFMSKK